jgi:hypothetical protein
LNLTKQGEEFIVMNNHETNMKYWSKYFFFFLIIIYRNLALQSISSASLPNMGFILLYYSYFDANITFEVLTQTYEACSPGKKYKFLYSIF